MNFVLVICHVNGKVFFFQKKRKKENEIYAWALLKHAKACLYGVAWS